MLVERHVVGVFDDRQHLLNHAGHGVGVRQISGGEAGIDQMQGKRHGLAFWQRPTQIIVHGVDQRLTFGVFARIQRTHFRLERVFDGLPFLRPLDRAADMVGQCHDQCGLRLDLLGKPGTGHGIGNQSNDLRRDPGQQFGHMVGIPAVRRNESADDLRIVDMLARFGLEAYATTGENHLTVAILGQHDIVVEYTKNVHIDPFLQ
ncbi:conserved hypothetical protein [Bifidobacterium dentium JCM 1195 = DSM 20436]|uniref:Uncharacterized protein n=1 Tax=Bifidobacterium dentium (strain ATCC 27534 / DSM 20436 / JCM 1195 / Bd1) TaxID=401473 RepID=D2Q8M1_BIFDB|nr:hypothetical protein BDP_0483 [Bifidobacterium dentium Bd1]BAQ26455.1 conserved hypothetical protein [Bifidobacterium dentium JCM 1195 = DSM 20436]